MPLHTRKLQKTLHEEGGPVTSILMSREVEVGPKVKCIAQASACRTEGKSLFVLQVNCGNVYTKAIELCNLVDTYNLLDTIYWTLTILWTLTIYWTQSTGHLQSCGHLQSTGHNLLDTYNLVDTYNLLHSYNLVDTYNLLDTI